VNTITKTTCDVAIDGADYAVEWYYNQPTEFDPALYASLDHYKSWLLEHNDPQMTGVKTRLVRFGDATHVYSILNGATSLVRQYTREQLEAELNKMVEKKK
jgi:hypothetical protein